jgi:hypothetical protein
MKRIFWLAALATVATSLASAQDVVGDWQGTLSPMGDIELRLVLHITKSSDGTLKATLDSVDQGQNGMAVTDLSLEGTHLTFDVDAVNGSYRGKVMGDGKTILGRWQQGRPMDLEFERSTTPIKTEHKPGKPSDIDGAWLGTLDMGERKLRVVFHILNTEDGLMATIGAPDQGPQLFPATSLTRDGASLKIEAKQFGGVYTAKIAADHSAIDGTRTQGEHSLPLLLKPVKDPAELQPRKAEDPPKP